MDVIVGDVQCSAVGCRSMMWTVMCCTVPLRCLCAGVFLFFALRRRRGRFYITPLSFVANNFWLELSRKDKEAGK